MTNENKPSSQTEVFYAMSALTDALADLSMAMRKLYMQSKCDEDVNSAVVDIHNICSSIENIEAMLMISGSKDGPN